MDEGAFRRLVDYAIDEGAAALMPTALTGEGPLLTEEETFVVWDTVFEANRGRIPVLPAVISFTTEAAVRRVEVEAEGRALVEKDPADDKDVRNYLIARCIADTLESLDLKYPPADPKLADVEIR